MYIEGHNRYFGVKTLSETPFSPPLKKPGYGTRLEEVFLRVADGMHEADGNTKEKRRGPPAAVPSELPTARK